jgi:hypothetical protein
MLLKFISLTQGGGIPDDVRSNDDDDENEWLMSER